MQSNSTMKAVLAVVLCVSMLATGCTSQWISVALADLPVLAQMALNIAGLVASLQSVRQLNPAEGAAIQNISAEAGKDLTLLQTLYNQYKANPNSSTLQQIENVIGDINQNLPALLRSAHISDPALSSRIAAAVDLILTTVSSFAALIPHTAALTARTVAAQSAAVPRAQDLKKRWNRQVCAPTGNAVFDSALAACVLK
jgi:hypothetical protein